MVLASKPQLQSWDTQEPGKLELPYFFPLGLEVSWYTTWQLCIQRKFSFTYFSNKQNFDISLNNYVMSVLLPFMLKGEEKMILNPSTPVLGLPSTLSFNCE